MNPPQKIVRVLLLLLVLAGIGVWAWRTFGRAGGGAVQGSGGAAEVVVAEPAHLVVVTYFTTNQRCPTCLKIEKQTREAMESGFGREMADGLVRFRTVNFDLAENQHFIKDYDLAFKTVVVSERRAGKEGEWEKFDKVWDLVGDPPAFAAYLQEGVRKHLTE